MSINTDSTVIRYKAKAHEIIGVAQQRGYDVPPEFTTAMAIGAEAARVAREPEPVISMPAKPDAVAAAIAKAAKARLEHREGQAVADQIEANCTRAAIGAALAVAPSYAAKICDEYNALLETFTELASTAPHEVTGNTSPEEFLQHAELLRAREGLMVAYAHRGTLARHIEADEAAVGANAIWLILDPGPNAALSEVRTVLTDYATVMPETIDDWARIARLGSSMAAPGETAGRIARFVELTQAAANTPDGGVLERTYGEALALRRG